MTEPTTKDEINVLCKETFLTWKKAMVLIYILAGVALSTVGTAVGWAMSTGNTLATLTEKSFAMEQNQNRLDNEINKKLDILINRK